MAEDRIGDPLFAASVAQKRAYARAHASPHTRWGGLAHGYSFFLHSGGDIVADPVRTRPRRDLGQYAGFGVFSQSWPKIPFAAAVMRRIPEGAWVWVVDSDMAIMNMSRGLAGPIAATASRGCRLAMAGWYCGDGINAGSWLLKNDEWGRGFVQRLADQRLPPLYLHDHGASSNEQPAFWVLQAEDPDMPWAIRSAPPREFNAIDPEMRCAKDEDKARRVYWHDGDLVTHLSHVIRKKGGRELFASRLAHSGWWPCPAGGGCARGDLSAVADLAQPGT
eukprot:gene16606-26031_t